MSGFCALPAQAQLAGCAPAPALRAFLAAGPKPIYLGWGSMIAGGAEHLAALAVGAAMRAGARAVVLGGWARIGAAGLPAPLRAYAWLCSHLGASRARQRRNGKVRNDAT